MVTGLMEPKLRMYSSQCTVVALSAGKRNKPKSIPAKPSRRINFTDDGSRFDERKIRTCGSITALMRVLFCTCTTGSNKFVAEWSALSTNHETSGEIFKSKRYQIFPRVWQKYDRDGNNLCWYARSANRFYFTRECTSSNFCHFLSMKCLFYVCIEFRDANFHILLNT